ncbi:tRNA N6-adenosine threonylcarbamoyltransferase, mitochondrial isoform X1 [Procambarus clarkii]|uniref:tRNA N6-adenosine threonylcarbamoyltransferase, mitochondrial isoform X1 n=1 Tax=Procambarus clarkii TaxID=6728 RepID=UPI001E67840C|nr:probable tRNA N6-adenosine threonylcarbamoyltransferase, mitochondrial isoform X2 [Procambarus clarkii]
MADLIRAGGICTSLCFWSLSKRPRKQLIPIFRCLTHIHQSSHSLLQINYCNTRASQLNVSEVSQATSLSKYGKQVVLGIETSCDDTGAAVINDSGEVLGEALLSQQSIHLRHGGIIPPLAQRMHRQNIEKVVSEALDKAGLAVGDLDAIATTVKPGLALSLSVGTNYGKHLALYAGKPFIPIHHMEAHALTIRMVHKVEFPFLVLLLSGGHCLIVIAHSLDHWSIIGQTVDDAPGEALDKGARRLKLRNIPECSSMSGGHAIEYLASSGNPRAYEFPTPMGKYRDCSFSFSGLKHSLVKVISKLEEEYEVEGGRIIPPIKDVCASFQYAITKHLVRQTQKAMVYIDVRNLLPEANKILVVSGGVACNQYIRNALQKLCEVTGYQLLCPPPKLCTDNGIMIAWNGMERWKTKTGILYNKEDIEGVQFQSRCQIGEDLTDDVRNLGIPAQKWVKF